MEASPSAEVNGLPPTMARCDVSAVALPTVKDAVLNEAAAGALKLEAMPGAAC